MRELNEELIKELFLGSDFIAVRIICVDGVDEVYDKLRLFGGEREERGEGMYQ